jgi:hypothetical protein
MTLRWDNEAWRKSSFSTATGECVEVARGAEAIRVRDSKNSNGPALTVALSGWSALLRTLD